MHKSKQLEKDEAAKRFYALAFHTFFISCLSYKKCYYSVRTEGSLLGRIEGRELVWEMCKCRERTISIWELNICYVVVE